MVTLTSGALALPIPEDTDPWWLLPNTVRSMGNQLELTAKPVPVGYTALWTTQGGGSPSLGSTGDSRSFYWRIGQDLAKVFVWMRFNGSGINGGSGQWLFELPYEAWGLDALGFIPQSAGFGSYWDDSAGEFYPIVPKVRATDATRLSLSCHPTTAGNAMRNVTGTVPVAVGAGDQVQFQLDYKADFDSPV